MEMHSTIRRRRTVRTYACDACEPASGHSLRDANDQLAFVRLSLPSPSPSFSPSLPTTPPPTLSTSRTSSRSRLLARRARSGSISPAEINPADCASSDPEPPTAIIYESAVLGVTGLSTAQQMGYGVPEDLSIVAWDDSLMCQVVHPPLTAVARDIPAYGEAAAIRLLDEIEGRGGGDTEVPRGVLKPRSTTAPPAGSALARRTASRAR